ncbi:hypothetical protein D9M70_482230 [compost metagenome]
MPCRGCEQRFRRLPFSRQDVAEGHGYGADEACGNADFVQRGLRRQHQQRDADNADNGCDEGHGTDQRLQEERCDEYDDQGLDRRDGCRDAAGKAVGRDEQHAQKDRDVERAEREGAKPPDAARQSPDDQEEQQPGRQCPQQGDRQRREAMQELGGNDIGAAPDDGGNRRQGDIGNVCFHEK